MRSSASYQGHPLHPMLIPYPFAFLTGAFGFTLAAAVAGRRDLETVSRHLIPAGVACGLVAAVPGIIDYFGSVPPRSSARDRAWKHGVLNSTSLGLFALSWLLGRRGGRVGPLMLQGAGTAAMSAAGYLGGTLVYRNQIGVDHRYAGAGTWREARAGQSDGGPLKVTGDGLDVNQMMLVHQDGTRIAVGRTEEGYVAFDDRCTHRGGPLSDGVLICGTVQCPWHGSQFDAHTGAVTCGPADAPLATYDVSGLPAARVT